MPSFKFAHNNLSVSNLEKSLAFYKEAFGLEEVRRKEGSDFTLVFLGDHGQTPHQLELTWNWDRKEIYDLGDAFHLALSTTDMKAAYALHKKMGCVCFENHKMGIYFVLDPDKYWIEVVPDRVNPDTVYLDWKPEEGCIEY
jgi:lactoylglutathione lyase